MKKRYFISLSLSFFIYLFAATLFLCSFGVVSLISDKDIEQKIVSLSINDFIPKVEEVKKEEHVEPQKEPKIEKKEIIKPTPPKKIEKVQKREKSSLVKSTMAKKSNQKIVGSSQKKVRLLELKERIASKKYYPEFAKKRGIEGRVVVTMKILPNGALGGLRMEGPKVFYPSIRKIVRESFPLQVSGCVTDLPTEVSVNLDYSLKE
ncbi:MAG: energy transducer TonB [Campylobacterales bacterium]|nr:energy transducer TonB [Campylobacterales bacterium]